MEWFRLYSEFATDPKVQMMPEAMQRRLIMLFCLQCSNGIETFHETERETAIAFAMRISETELAETKELFLRRGFINDDWTLANWDKRQYVSDSSTARVRKHRAAKKQAEKQGETLPKRSSNALEQNRTDTEQSIETLSGKPDVAPKDSPEVVQAKKAIDYLNFKTNSRFQKIPTNLDLVKARLSEGFTWDDVKAVIDRQVLMWADDPKMSEYLRPSTLFNKTKFAQYAGKTNPENEGWWTLGGFDTEFDAINAGMTRHNIHRAGVTA